MVTVDPKKTVRVTAEPIESDPSPSKELSDHMRLELKNKNKIDGVEY